MTPLSSLVQPNRNHADLVFVLRQHIAGRQIVGRRGHNAAHVTQKFPLQGTVYLEQSTFFSQHAHLAQLDE